MKNCLDRKCKFLFEADEFFFCDLHKLEIFNPGNAGCGQEKVPTLTLIRGGRAETEISSHYTSHGYSLQRRTRLN